MYSVLSLLIFEKEQLKPFKLGFTQLLDKEPSHSHIEEILNIRSRISSISSRKKNIFSYQPILVSKTDTKNNKW